MNNPAASAVPQSPAATESKSAAAAYEAALETIAAV